MRVLRVVAGILTLLLALPVLVAGGLAWWAMQHRSPDGAFRASMMPVDAPGRVLVVPDIDAILRRDAPIARAEQTTLRLSANGFIGMAEPADVAAFLAGSGYTTLHGVTLSRGPLPTRTSNVNGSMVTSPKDQDFWVRSGSGELTWTPAVDRGQRLALVIVAAPGDEPIRVGAAVTAGWLNSTTWGLLILGPVMMLLGFAALAWPQRPREIVYVMDRSAVPGIPGMPGTAPRQMPLGAPDPAPYELVAAAPAIDAGVTVADGARPAAFPATSAPPSPVAAAPPAAAPPTAAPPAAAAAPTGTAATAADRALTATTAADRALTAATAADRALTAATSPSGAAAVSTGTDTAAHTPAPATAADAVLAADHGPADGAVSETAARLQWPPPEQSQGTEPARDLPMPVAGVHLHLSKRP